MATPPPSPLGLAGAVLGVAGVLVLLGSAVYRLLPRAIEPISTGLAPWQWGLYAAIAIFIAYTEGYRAMQLRFGPRVVARAIVLARDPRLWLVLLAPAFAMALLHARRRRLIASWILVVAIVVMVILVQRLDQPYRGMIDGGVVVGLSWGIATILAVSVQALRGRPPAIDPDLP
jgi:hypothetical protein